ncbi:MAG: cation diffusion facilitator family transporter [Pseudorhodoplanes sp.]|nr:Ferrous-iron efflux pump FieF [Pseudorhodoplanes sp.]MBW7950177.1 cation diffusion facilitator family transporter [Pseudorhodoplanes sp.]MCL4712236.1 cation diffusion facilitator family transporter [Pseudorhodoplanes sp.]
MQQTKEKVALSSIVASGGLTVAKAIVGFSTGSLAILSEAAHSLLDFVATVMTYFAVRISGQPADEEHHYGHGKVESVTALAATGLLFLLSGIVLWEAGKRLLAGESHVEATIPAFVVIIASIVIDFFRARLLYRVASETSSEALEADALHFGSDMWSSLAVLVGLIGIAFGYWWADAAAAIVVAVFVCLAGWRLGRRTIDTLLDTAPAGLSGRLTRLAGQVPGVVAVESVRARQVGPQVFVELGLAVSRTLPMDRVAALKDKVRNDILSDHPGAEISITIDPRALDDETVMERVMVIARNRALAVHHVTVHDLDGRLSVSLDLEVDGTLPLGAAHAIADGLETAINDELGSEVEVETHIEPLQVYDESGRDAGPARVRAIAADLSALAATLGTICDVHDVRVRETAQGDIVNFHCRADAGEPVHVVHEKVDELERALRVKWPSIKRVIGHAEPSHGTDL